MSHLLTPDEILDIVHEHGDRAFYLSSDLRMHIKLGDQYVRFGILVEGDDLVAAVTVVNQAFERIIKQRLRDGTLLRK